MKTDKRIDAYTARSQEFARPILIHLRELVQKTCPGAEETMKWSFPHFVYSGEILCSMVAFKQHVSFGFWKASLLKDKNKVLKTVGDTAMGHFGKITSLSDLPPDKVIIDLIRQAMKLNESGIKVPGRTKTAEKKELLIPDYFSDALRRSKKAQKTFDSFSYSNRKEYVEWVTEAKTEATREKRLATAIEWMEEGKVRNWKYIR